MVRFEGKGFELKGKWKEQELLEKIPGSKQGQIETTTCKTKRGTFVAGKKREKVSGTTRKKKTQLYGVPCMP